MDMLADAVLAAERDVVRILTGGLAGEYERTPPQVDPGPSERVAAALARSAYDEALEKMALKRKNDEERMYALGYETVWMPGETKTRVSDKQKPMYTKTWCPEGDTSGVPIGDHTFNKKDILRKRRSPAPTTIPYDPAQFLKKPRLPGALPPGSVLVGLPGRGGAASGLFCDKDSLDRNGARRPPGALPPSSPWLTAPSAGSVPGSEHVGGLPGGGAPTTDTGGNPSDPNGRPSPSDSMETSVPTGADGRSMPQRREARSDEAETPLGVASQRGLSDYQPLPPLPMKSDSMQMVEALHSLSGARPKGGAAAAQEGEQPATPASSLYPSSNGGYPAGGSAGAGMSSQPSEGGPTALPSAVLRAVSPTSGQSGLPPLLIDGRKVKGFLTQTVVPPGAAAAAAVLAGEHEGVDTEHNAAGGYAGVDSPGSHAWPGGPPLAASSNKRSRLPPAPPLPPELAVYGKPNWKPSRQRCGACAGCMRKDCVECPNCLDKPKFGGQGRWKQACEKRICMYPQPSQTYQTFPQYVMNATAAGYDRAHINMPHGMFEPMSPLGISPQRAARLALESAERAERPSSLPTPSPLGQPHDDQHDAHAPQHGGSAGSSDDGCGASAAAMTTLSSMHAGGSLGPHGAPPGIENRSVGGSLKPIPGLGEGQRLGGGGGANSAAKPKKTKRCGECPGCRHDVREDCGECLNCLDKPKFGGANQRKQACVKRTCTNPQPNPEYYASLPGAAAAAAAAAVAAGGSGGGTYSVSGGGLGAEAAAPAARDGATFLPCLSPATEATGMAAVLTAAARDIDNELPSFEDEAPAVRPPKLDPAAGTPDAPSAAGSATSPTTMPGAAAVAPEPARSRTGRPHKPKQQFGAGDEYELEPGRVRPAGADDEPKRRKGVADGRTGGSGGASGSGGGGAVNRPAAAAAGASPGVSTCHACLGKHRAHTCGKSGTSSYLARKAAEGLCGRTQQEQLLQSLSTYLELAGGSRELLRGWTCLPGASVPIPGKGNRPPEHRYVDPIGRVYESRLAVAQALGVVPFNAEGSADIVAPYEAADFDEEEEHDEEYDEDEGENEDEEMEQGEEEEEEASEDAEDEQD